MTGTSRTTTTATRSTAPLAAVVTSAPHAHVDHVATPAHQSLPPAVHPVQLDIEGDDARPQARTGKHAYGQLQLMETMTRTRLRRQQAGAGVGNVNEGYPACNDVSNAVLACFPQSDTVLVQNSWSKFVWNTNYPVFIGAGYLDIHLFDAGSEEELVSWRNISTYRGSIGYQVNDEWLPDQTTWSQGQTLTHSYYFVVATRGANAVAGVSHQATFEILQTQPPATLAAAIASSSSAASASSASAAAAAAAASSSGSHTITAAPGATLLPTTLSPTDPELGSIPVSLTGSFSTITNIAGLTSAAASISSAEASVASVISSLSAAGQPIPSSLLSSLSALSSSADAIASTESSVVSSVAKTRGPSTLQGNNKDGNSVPRWAIALIVVFGVLALLAAIVGAWFCLRRMRRRREEEYRRAGGDSITTGSHIGAAGAEAAGAGAGAGAAAAAAGEREPMRERPGSVGAFSEGTGNTARFSNGSNPPGSALARTMSGGGAGAAAGVGLLAGIAGGRRSTSPVTSRTLDRSNTDRTDSPYGTQLYDTPPSARFGPTSPAAMGMAATGSTSSNPASPTHHNNNVINKASHRSLATAATSTGSTIALRDAAIMADAYRNVLRKPEFPRRNNDDSQNNSGNSSGDSSIDHSHNADVTGSSFGVGGGVLGRRRGDDRDDDDDDDDRTDETHTPKAEGTTTPMGFGDSSGSEGGHHGQGIIAGEALRRKLDPSASDSSLTDPGTAAGAGTGGHGITSGGRRKYGGRESDEEDGSEANELIKHELASEGTSVKSNVERKRPDIRHD